MAVFLDGVLLAVLPPPAPPAGGAGGSAAEMPPAFDMPLLLGVPAGTHWLRLAPLQPAGGGAIGDTGAGVGVAAGAADAVVFHVAEGAGRGGGFLPGRLLG